MEDTTNSGHPEPIPEASAPPVSASDADFSSAFDLGREENEEAISALSPPKPNLGSSPAGSMCNFLPAEASKDANEAGPSGSATETNIPQDVFFVKQIATPHDKLSIILQSVNGPCPIIAIMNCLLLQRKFELPADNEYITASRLCSILGNYLLDRAAQQSSTQKQHTEQYILDSLDRFVQIQTGIDINVKFSSVEGFEYTPELSLFDLASARLLHGWVVDPQDTVLAELVGELSYNQLVEKTMAKSCSVDTREVSEYLILKDHLESSQLTVHGICEINATLNTGEFAVLFRNNHFSTITKHDNMVYVLVTDIGWAEEDQVIWETLDSTCNSTSFVNGHFKISEAPSGDAIYSTVDNDEEYALSLELQISKEEQLEQQRLWDEAKLNSQQPPVERRNRDIRHKEKPATDLQRKSSSSCSLM